MTSLGVRRAAWLAPFLFAALAGCPKPGSRGPELILSASSVAIDVTAGQPRPDLRYVEITYTGERQDSFHESVSYVSGTPGWLEAGVGGIGAAGHLSLGLVSTALPPGSYRALVTVFTHDTSPVTVTVDLDVAADGVNPVIALDRFQVDFRATQAAPLPPDQQLTVTNAGTGTLDAPTLSDDATWLTVTASGGTLTLHADGTGLPVGTHAAVLQVTVANATPATVYVPVLLQVSRPSLAPSVTGLSFQATVGSSPPPQVFTVSNSGSGALDGFTVASSERWLTAAAVGTSAPFTVVALVDVSGMPMGSRAATLTLTSPGASDSPLTLPVSLAVGPNDFEQDLSTVGGALTAIYDAYFDRLQACALMPQPFVDWAKRDLADEVQSLQDAADAGRLTYSPSAARACVAMERVVGCDALLGTVARCSKIWRGLVENGAPCFADEECAQGWCSQGLTCPGVCLPKVGEGESCVVSGRAGCWSGACGLLSAVCVPDVPGGLDEPCGSGDVACEPGLWCAIAGDGLWMPDQPRVQPMCRAARGLDEPCQTSRQCAVGLGCAYDSVCRPLVAEGESCLAAACGQGAYCSLAAGRRCVAVPVYEGADCSELPYCQVAGLECSTGGRCVAPTIAAGGACDDLADRFCVAGTTCVAGTCVPVTVGDACY